MYMAPTTGMYAPAPGTYATAPMTGTYDPMTGMYMAPTTGMYAPAPGTYATAPMTGTYDPMTGMYMAPTTGMYAPAPGTYATAPMTGTYDPATGMYIAPTYTAPTYDPATGMYMAPTTYLLPTGWIGGTCAGYTAPAGAYCDPNSYTWITVGAAPVGWIAGPCAGYSPPPGATCDPATNMWMASGATLPTGWIGGMCSGYSAPAGAYCDPNTYTWVASGATLPVGWIGGICTGYSPPAGAYCQGGYWASGGGGALPAGWAGGPCAGYSPPAGNFSCDIATSTWVAYTVGTPGFISAGVPTPNPAATYMYDAFGAQVLIPGGGYRNISYVYGMAANATAMEISIDNQIIAPGGWSTYFSAPSSNGTATSSINMANFTMGIAAPVTPQMDFGYDPVSGMSWGRWQGNWIIGVPSIPSTVTQASNSNLHWFATSTQSGQVLIPKTGILKYTFAGGTSPTDNYGTIGTLNSAIFDANFTAQQVNVSIGVSMPASIGGAPAVQMNATANNVPILPGANFKTTSPTVTCSGCGTAPTGVIGGQFSQGAVGVGVGYGLTNGAQVINGVTVFHK